MQRFLIVLANGALLVFLVIGLPAATRDQFGNVQLSSASAGRLALFCGLGIAAASNLLAALILTRGHKHKALCWEWAALFGALGLVYYATVRGWIGFEWLKHALLWLQSHL